ncbi:PH domain-containing protein [Microbacterium gilvum]|uniref:Low molecular weight protein antigen 6 PH domain-containing protein n=1 Tax=Microbacterium gilvum TaxID=1336204 RepID=A0ABP8ZVU5_9MICO
MTGYRIAFRRAAGWLGLVLVGTGCGLLLVDAALRASPFDALLVAPWLLALCWAVYVLFAAPSVVADDDLLRVRNILHVVEIPWHEIADIRMRWQLEVVLRDGRIVRALGAAPRHLHSRHLCTGRAPEPGDDQADTLRLFLARARTSDRDVRRRVDVPSLVALCVIAVGATWSLVVAA